MRITPIVPKPAPVTFEITASRDELTLLKRIVGTTDFSADEAVGAPKGTLQGIYDALRNALGVS